MKALTMKKAGFSALLLCVLASPAVALDPRTGDQARLESRPAEACQPQQGQLLNVLFGGRADSCPTAQVRNLSPVPVARIGRSPALSFTGVSF